MEVPRLMEPDLKARADLLEQILGDLGFKSNNRSWPLKENGRRMLATIHADKLWDIVEIVDWDKEQEL